jgi:hypothetical protein
MVGIDRNGTSRDAIKILRELQASHASRVSCKVSSEALFVRNARQDVGSSRLRQPYAGRAR